MSKRTHNTLTLAKKRELINDITKGVKKCDVSVKYGIPRSTVSTIWKNRDKVCELFNNAEYSENVKRVRRCTYEDIDKSVFSWFSSLRAQNLPVTGALIKEKAAYYADALGHKYFNASEGWLSKFKIRHNIVGKALCGESASVSNVLAENWIEQKLPSLIEPYSPNNIFNADETGLFFKCLPNKTLTFKNQRCFGGKHSKERVTVLLGANMSGTEKLKVVLIGKSSNPRCFRGVKSLGLDYYSNKKAWMTTEIFEKWLLNLDQKFATQNRKILLFLDNCTSHPKDIQTRLKFITLQYFPANTTSVLQPMDMGIIKSMKAFYRKNILLRTVSMFEENNQLPKINLLDCVRITLKAWACVTEETIKSCFQKAGFGRNSCWDDEDLLPLSELQKGILKECDETEYLWDRLLELGVEVQGESFQDYVHIDDKVIVSDIPTDADILDKVSKVANAAENLDSSSSEEETMEVVHQADIQKALNVLHSALELNEDVPETVFTSLQKVKIYFEKQIHSKVLKQMKILDFFKPQ